MSRLKYVFSEAYRMKFDAHVFPTEKYQMIVEQLEKEGYLVEEDLLEPESPDERTLSLVHDPQFIQDLLDLRWTERTMCSELPLNRSVVSGFMLCAGGSYLASRQALSDGLCYHVGGGFHHASRNRAEGFCYINDIAYAVAKLREEGAIRRAAVIDCDLHQGNGTAMIFEDDASIFTFSIHQEYNYPMPKARSDRDIGLPDGTGDEAYTSLLRPAVQEIYDSHKPELVVYQAGADPFIEDALGGLALSKTGLLERDRLVLEEARKRGIPVSITLGGGYARELHDLVDIHAGTAKVAFDLLQVESP
jgi:acetoin utilization deacetylase AcuC-like enzyme